MELKKQTQAYMFLKSCNSEGKSIQFDRNNELLRMRD